MKKILLILSIIVLYKNSAHAQTPANDRNWNDTLTFFDDFKYPNYIQFHYFSTKFNQTTYFAGGNCTFDNFNRPSYLKDSIYCTTDGNNLHFDSSGKGVTTIVTRKKYYHISCGDSFPYTTGCLQRPTSFGGGAQKYGYWEMRWRIPQPVRKSYNDSTAGFDVAFWLTGNTSFQPYYSELDMFEMNTWNNAFYGSCHYRLAGDSLPNTTYRDIISYSHGYYVYPSGNYPPGGWPTPLPPLVTNGPDIDSTKGFFYPTVNYNQSTANDTGWHKYGMDWEPNFVNWYIDDTLAKTVYYNYSVFNDSMYLIIDNFFPASSKLDGSPIYQTPTTFPYNYDIDYVKTYKLIPDCEDAYSACFLNLSTYPWGVKQSVEITGCLPTNITSGQNVTLRAVNSVKLDKNFTVGLGAAFHVIMQPCPN